MSPSISASVAAAIESCSDCCTLYDDCADCSTLSLAAATAAPWPPSSSDLLACCAAAAAFPHPPQPAPSPWQQQQKDCYQCAATDTMGVSTNEEVAAAAAKSHLAWCCDDAECLPSTTAAARTSSPETSLAYESTAPAYNAATTTAISTPVEEDWMRWSAAALATATAAAEPRLGPTPPSPCLDPSCHPVGGVVVVSPPSEFSTIADCPSCTAGPSTSTSTGTPFTTTTTTTTMDDHHQHGLDQDGLPHTDLDELLNGLDEETIQDILNCCCCDTALHDQPATFDPASHTQHQQLPQHIHCHDPHDLPPPPPLPPPPSLGAFAPALAPAGGGGGNALDVSVTNFLGHRQQPGFSSTSAAAASSSTTTQPLPPFCPGYSVAQSLLPTSPSTITTCAGSSSSSNRASYLEEEGRPLSNPATTRQPNAALPPTTPPGGDGGHRITKPLRCEWRTCTASFGTHEALVAHVLTTHLATPSSSARNITTTATAATTTTTATGSDDVMSHPLLLSRLASALMQLTEEANGPREVANTVREEARGIDTVVRAFVEAVRGASASGGIATPSSSSHAGGGDAVRSLDKTGLPRRPRSPHLHPPINSHSHSHSHPHFRGRPSSRPPPSHGTTHSHTHHHARGVPKHHHHPYGAARAHAAAVEAAKQKKEEEEEAGEEEDGEEQEAAATTTTRTGRRGPNSSGSEVLSGDGSRKRRRVVGTPRAAAAPTLSSLATEMATTTTTTPPSPASLYDLATDLRSAGTVEGNGDALAIAAAAAALSQARGTTVAAQSPPLIDTPPSPSTVSSASIRGDSSEGSQNQAQAQLQYHPCRWRGCPAVFETTASLMEHLSTVHVGAGKARYTCEWDGCERSTGVVCFGEEQQQLDCWDEQEKEGEWRNRGAAVDEETFESARDARDDKGVFRQRQKVMRHLQMHTGDRPYACQVCGKTFSESLTLKQHMRVHTQERPYECDHPGCGKAFALASALTIHKRTHTGSRPFTCPFPGCSAAFSESSNLSKHLRVHSTERKYPCLEPGCGKAFARSDQLKRHRRVHEKEKEREKETG